MERDTKVSHADAYTGIYTALHYKCSFTALVRGMRARGCETGVLKRAGVQWPNGPPK